MRNETYLTELTVMGKIQEKRGIGGSTQYYYFTESSGKPRGVRQGDHHPVGQGAKRTGLNFSQSQSGRTILYSCFSFT